MHDGDAAERMLREKVLMMRDACKHLSILVWCPLVIDSIITAGATLTACSIIVSSRGKVFGEHIRLLEMPQ